MVVLHVFSETGRQLGEQRCKLISKNFRQFDDNIGGVAQDEFIVIDIVFVLLIVILATVRILFVFKITLVFVFLHLTGEIFRACLAESPLVEQVINIFE